MNEKFRNAGTVDVGSAPPQVHVYKKGSGYFFQADSGDESSDEDLIEKAIEESHNNGSVQRSEVEGCSVKRFSTTVTSYEKRQEPREGE